MTRHPTNGPNRALRIAAARTPGLTETTPPVGETTRAVEQESPLQVVAAAPHEQFVMKGGVVYRGGGRGAFVSRGGTIHAGVVSMTASSGGGPSFTTVKLPNAEHAEVDVAKLRYYCLSPSHPRGRHKARVFSSRLGLGPADAERLRAILLDAARTATNAVRGSEDAYGTRHVLDLPVWGPYGGSTIRSHWIVRRGESFARLITCHVR